MGEPKGVGHSHPLGPSRTAAAHCQFAACFNHIFAGIPARLLFSFRHFPAASAPAFGAGAGCKRLSQVCGPTPGLGSGCSPPPRSLRAAAPEVPPPPAGSPSQCPAALGQPHGTPGRSRQSWARIRAATRVGGDGARLLMCNWPRHLSPAREERGRAGAGPGPGAAEPAVGTRWRPEPCGRGHTSPGTAGSAGSQLSPRLVFVAGSFLEPNGSYLPALLGLQLPLRLVSGDGTPLQP